MLEPRSAKGEHASNLYCIPADFGWNDLGSWAALYEHRASNHGGHNNVIQGANSFVSDADGNLILAPKKFVAAIGVNNLVVVETEDGVRLNVSVGIQYIAAWLAGTGAAAINNLMEDAATAEISRSQIWQWVRHGRVEKGQVEEVAADELEKLGDAYRPAAELFQQVALDPEFVEFLTLPAYGYID